MELDGGFLPHRPTPKSRMNTIMIAPVFPKIYAYETTETLYAGIVRNNLQRATKLIHSIVLTMIADERKFEQGKVVVWGMTILNTTEQEFYGAMAAVGTMFAQTHHILLNYNVASKKRAKGQPKEKRGVMVGYDFKIDMELSCLTDEMWARVLCECDDPCCSSPTHSSSPPPSSASNSLQDPR